MLDGLLWKACVFWGFMLACFRLFRMFGGSCCGLLGFNWWVCFTGCLELLVGMGYLGMFVVLFVVLRLRFGYKLVLMVCVCFLGFAYCLVGCFCIVVC